MAKRRLARPDLRVSVDAVTGERQVTVLDGVQRAYERCVACLDRERKSLSTADGYRLVDRVREALETMVPHQDGEAA